MNLPEYDRMFENEDRYWWYVSRRELVVRYVRSLGLPRNARLVDVGCGTGATASELGQFGKVVGVDLSDRALNYCTRRGLSHLVRGRVEALPLASRAFDVLVATDIIEHIDDDLAGLREFLRVLKPGGHAVITVPAYQFLWSEHDEALMHKRRYLARQVSEQAAAAGFTVERLTYALGFLLPMALPRLLRKDRPRDREPEAQIVPVSPWINNALVRLQRVEGWLSERMSIPCGLSVATVLRRPPVDARHMHRVASRAVELVA
jgi:SAM-dependent methyltransferase